jgi:aminoglycoside phosphotransferase (APT) family kinase protein
LERRTAIVELDAAELEASLRSVLPSARLTSSELAMSGRANSIYLVQTNRGRFVLRLHIRDERAGAKERAIARTYGGQVPVAAVLGHGETSSGHAFTLLSHVPGDTLEQVLLSANRPRIEHAARSLGRTVAQLSNIRFEQSGDLTTTESGTLVVEPWPFSDFFQWALFESPAGPRLGSLRDRLRSFLETTASRYPDPWHQHLVHADFNPTNLLIAETGDLTAVLDWEFAHAGSIWFDLGNLLRHRPSQPLPDYFIPPLLEGLTDAGVTLPSHWRALSLITDLSSACEFLSSPHDRPEAHAQAKNQIRETLAQLEA